MKIKNKFCPKKRIYIIKKINADINVSRIKIPKLANQDLEGQMNLGILLTKLLWPRAFVLCAIILSIRWGKFEAI